MSASPIARQACSQMLTIPTKRVLINDHTDLPDIYSSTPNGTIYSTTPGGTRIVYERAFLMNLKNSPLSRTPPTTNLPNNILRNSSSSPSGHKQMTSVKKAASAPRRNSPPKFDEHQEQFDMDL
uniref:Putative eukaryotic translation initiation factor 4e binding protein 4ebp n=1 Tax=Corethrella appendiculata TaxID=1370023 RepID=U5EQY3_9DIPT